MSTKDALADARIALRRGQKSRAQIILQNILAIQRDNNPARLMLDELLRIGQPEPALREKLSIPRPAARAAQEQIKKKTTSRASGNVASAQPTHDSRPKRKTQCPICKAKIRPGMMQIHNEYYHPSRGTDALDHAVSLSDTAGIAMVKASRKKRGGR